MDEGVGLFVQVVLTASQAQLLALAASEAAQEVPKETPALADEFHGLANFFSYVGENPRSFPVRGQMAKSIKTRMRMMRRARSYQG